MNIMSIFIIAIFAAHLIILVLVIKSLLQSSRNKVQQSPDGRKMLRPSQILLWTGILAAIWTVLGLYMGYESLT
ncbi:hypothetical protein MNBD_ALPHA11-191, partial [hydrothermal vent metagenome]